MILATDNFDRANTTTLGANWTKLSSFSDLGITSYNAQATVASPDCVDAYTGFGNIPVDMFAQAVCAAAPANDGGPTTRSDLAGTFYLVDCGAAGACNYFKSIAAVFTNIGVALNSALVAGDVCYFAVQGTTLSFTKTGVVGSNLTDSAIDGVITGGPRAGLHCSNTGITWDNWQCGAFNPTITLQPQQATVYDGMSARFTTNATGSGSVTYQWQVNGVDIGGATGNTLTVNPATFADNGKGYRCNVTDSVGTVPTVQADLVVLQVATPFYLGA